MIFLGGYSLILSIAILSLFPIEWPGEPSMLVSFLEDPSGAYRRPIICASLALVITAASMCVARSRLYFQSLVYRFAIMELYDRQEEGRTTEEYAKTENTHNRNEDDPQPESLIRGSHESDMSHPHR